jgi:hypothetical protein
MHSSREALYRTWFSSLSQITRRTMPTTWTPHNMTVDYAGLSMREESWLSYVESDASELGIGY